jgi:glucose/arabinose dehydrogenase
MEASMRIQSLTISALLLAATLALPALATGLETPWEIALAPEKVLWVPEPMGDSARQIDLDAGMKSAALAVDETFVGEEHADLLGLAFPPEFGMGEDHDFVYVAFAYDSGKSGAVEDRRSRIVQYQWDAEAGTLSDPVELLSGLPAGAGPR